MCVFLLGGVSKPHRAKTLQEQLAQVGGRRNAKTPSGEVKPGLGQDMGVPTMGVADKAAEGKDTTHGVLAVGFVLEILHSKMRLTTPLE